MQNKINLKKCESEKTDTTDRKTGEGESKRDPFSLISLLMIVCGTLLLGKGAHIVGWMLVATGIITEMMSVLRWKVKGRRQEKMKAVSVPCAPHPATLISAVRPGSFPAQQKPAYPPPQYLQMHREQDEAIQQQKQDYLALLDDAVARTPSARQLPLQGIPPPQYYSHQGQQSQEESVGHPPWLPPVRDCPSPTRLSPPPSYNEVTTGR